MNEKMKGKSLVLVVVAVMLVAVVSVGIYSGVIPTGFRSSVFSISEIVLDPTNGIVGVDSRLEGAYWVVNMVVDQAEAIYGNVTIPVGTTGTFEGQEITTNKRVEFKIKPNKAYFIRSIRHDPIMVTPETYKTILYYPIKTIDYREDVSVSGLTADVYIWDDAVWKTISVFSVEVYVDNELLDSKTMNTNVGREPFIIDTVEGEISITSLGSLAGSWSEPHVESDIMIFNEDYIYDYDLAERYTIYDNGGLLRNWKAGEINKVQVLESHLSPFSVYWYGEMRWADILDHIPDVRRTPVATQLRSGGLYLNVVPESEYGGWTKEEVWNAEKMSPVEPVIFPNQKTTYMNNMKEYGYSLTEYIEGRGIKNIGRKGSDVDEIFKGYDSWKIVGETIFVYAPFTAYQLPIIQILVPVELADTWVYQPQISNVRIVDIGWEGGGVVNEISGSKMFWVDVRQDSGIESTARLIVETSNSKAKVDPSYNEITLKPDETTRLYFTVTNLGTDVTIPVAITVKVKETWTGTITDVNTELSCTLMPTTMEEVTSLDVYVFDDDTRERIKGIQVYVESDVQKSWFTDSGGRASFDLGNYIGYVDILIGESVDYKLEMKTTKVSGGNNEVSMYLTPQVPDEDPEEPEVIDWNIIIAIVAIVALLIMLFIYIMIRGTRK